MILIYGLISASVTARSPVCAHIFSADVADALTFSVVDVVNIASVAAVISACSREMKIKYGK